MLIILLFFLIVFFIYAYINHHGEFTATACAIRQIWSGSCRLGCRQSEYSSFSGLSGLQGPGTSASEGPDTSQKAYHRNYSCVCDTCPCALIDNVLSTCRPVTSIYSEILEMISNYYCGIIQMLGDRLEYFTRVVNCGASCQRQAQFTCSKQLDSSQNISFGNPAREKRAESRVQAMKSLILRRKSTCPEEKLELDDAGEVPRDRSMSNISNNVIESPEQSDAIQGKSCSKCIEKGFTCMKNCPRAKKR